MSIILKHIMRNIKEHKVRSLLIVIALLISTCVLIIDIVLPDELFVKIEDTYKTIYGDTDVEVIAPESITLDDIKMQDIDYNYIGVNDITGEDKDENPVSVIGIDIDKAKEYKLLGKDVDNLSDNEVIVNEYNASKKGYKKGDIIKIKYETKEYEFIINKIVSKKGIAALEQENDMFITNLNNVRRIKNERNETYTSIFFDIKDEDKINSFVDYLKDNNKSYQTIKTVDLESLKEEIAFVRYLMTLIFFMSTIMIFFVIGSLNKIMLAERIPVIGTFRSVGANRRKMNGILLLENALYGLIAGILGSFAGIYLDGIVSKQFVVTSGVELSSKSISFSPKLMIIGVLFAVLLQIFITAKEIIRTNKKPIKTLIFNTQSSRYKIRKIRTIIGFISIALSVVIYLSNTKIEMLYTMLSLALLSSGVANVVPLLMQVVSKLLVKIFKKIGWSTGIISCKNIGYNKMIISSSRLVVVSLSLLSTILLVSNSFTKLFTSFREVTKGYNIIVQNVSYEKDKYEKLVSIEGIKEVDYLYYYYDEHTTYNDGKKFKTLPSVYATDKESVYVKGNKYKPKDIKENEIMIDEKVAFKNDIKVGDTLSIKYGSLNKTFKYKVVDLADSSYLSTNRNVIVVNYNHFIKDLTGVPMQLHIVTDDGVDLDKMKETLKKEIKEVGISVQTVKEYIDVQEEQMNSIMGIFYVIVGLSVVLSFIGIINNQVISFIQRRRELAILNSTCMSRRQLKKMLFVETVISNLIASIFVIIVAYVSTIYINYFMQGIDMYVNVEFNISIVLKFIGIIYVILLLTLIIPIRKIRKMNIVNEIKYE